jgi:hypothetical protein
MGEVRASFFAPCRAQYENYEQSWKELVKKSEEDETAGKPSGTPFRIGNGNFLTKNCAADDRQCVLKQGEFGLPLYHFPPLLATR